MKLRSTNQTNQFSQDRSLKLESLENRNLMTVGNVMVAAIVDDNHTHVESVTIGHEKNIDSLTGGQCEGACYLRDQGPDQGQHQPKISNGFLTQTGSAADIETDSIDVIGGLSYLRGQGQDQPEISNGFFIPGGSTVEIQDQELVEPLAILAQANGIEQASNVAYEDYWDMDMSIRHKGQDDFFGKLGSVPHIEYRGALEIYNGFVVPEIPTAGTTPRDAPQIYNGF